MLTTMTMSSYIFDSEWKQRADIESMKSRASVVGRSMRRRTGELSKRIEELEDDVAELTLTCRTLLTILRESGVVDPIVFAEKFADIDAEDGVIDGKVTKPEPEVRPTPPTRRRKRR